MEVVVMLRELWRRRWLVLLSGLLAVFIGLLMAYKVTPPFKFQSRAYTVGIASTTAMLDTPSSQVVDLGGQDSEVAASAGSLPGRAALLASVLTTSPLKEQIAKTAGIDPRTLIAGSPAPGSALPPAQLGSISAKSRNASFLTVTTFEGLPMLGVNVTARDEETAARLSNGAIKVLISHLNTLANADAVPVSRRLVVKQLGGSRAATAKHGPSRKVAAVAVVFIFGLLCAAILIVSWITTRWKEADAWERLPPIDWESISPEHFEQPVQDAPAHVNGHEPVAPPPPPDPPVGDRWDTVR
jgi:capsular polysaccharide biosynthesis protein